jgi:hypothetical protein
MSYSCYDTSKSEAKGGLEILEQTHTSLCSSSQKWILVHASALCCVRFFSYRTILIPSFHAFKIRTYVTLQKEHVFIDISKHYEWKIPENLNGLQKQVHDNSS